jgi:glutathione reductase (NADPH)
MLQHFDPDLVSWLMESFRRAGIEVRTEHVVDAVEQTTSGFLVHARTQNAEQTFDADLVVHAAGRIPDVDRLNLEAGQIERDERGHLKLNDFLQSVSNPAVFAAGDAAAKGPPLTPVSSHDAKVVVSNLLKGNQQRPDYRGIPSVAFTIPPIAKVGLAEDELVGRGFKARTKSEKASDWFTARCVNEGIYGFKVMVDERTDQILGAHLVGPNVDEVINLFGFAIRHGLTAEAMKTTIFAYPTGASDLGYML